MTAPPTAPDRSAASTSWASRSRRTASDPAQGAARGLILGLVLGLVSSGAPLPAVSPPADPPAGEPADLPPVAREALATGDRAWSERSRERGGAWGADTAAVERTVAAYERAVEAAPDALFPRRRLLAALYFQGEYVARGPEERRAVFDRGKEVAEAALARLASRVGVEADSLRSMAPEERVERLRAAGPELCGEDAAALYFWSGVHWGLWGDAYGRLAAAREGVAGTVRDDALTAIALDPAVEHAGPHRVLGRLHAEAPKVPFFTGWVDRDRAIAELERAVALAPDEPLNRLYLAEALFAHRPREGARARSQLRAILERPVEPPRAVEQASAREQAHALLEEAPR